MPPRSASGRFASGSDHFVNDPASSKRLNGSKPSLMSSGSKAGGSVKFSHDCTNEADDSIVDERTSPLPYMVGRDGKGSLTRGGAVNKTGGALKFSNHDSNESDDFVDDERTPRGRRARRREKRKSLAESATKAGKASGGAVKFGINFITRNGNLYHKTPVAPPADVNELEYISALHQCSSMQTLRDDASVTDKEISYYLKSRHGLEVDAATVRKVVLEGLTADKDDEDDDENSSGNGGDGGCEAGVMDLVEVTTALVIPFLLRTRNSSEAAKAMATIRRMYENGHSYRTSTRFIGGTEDDKDVEVLHDALRNILEDCTGDVTPKFLDKKLVKDILRGFGEGALADDDQLVQEMVEVASCRNGDPLTDDGPPRLDIEAFLEALTSDVNRQYDPGRFERSSTHFADVWFHNQPTSARDYSSRSTDVEHGSIIGTSRDKYEPTKLVEEHLSEKLCCYQKGKGGRSHAGTTTALFSPTSASIRRGVGSGNTITRLYTGQEIDYTTDNYRTRIYILFLWTAFAAFYVAYLGLGILGGGYSDDQCEGTNMSTLVVCPLVAGIVNQLLMIAELIFFGTPFIILGSVGNSIEGRESFTNLACGILLFTGYTLLFYCLDFEVPFWISTTNRPWMNTLAISLSFAVVFIQCLEFAMRFFRDYFPHKKWLYSRYFIFGNVHNEARFKRSGLFKIRRMLHNAHEVHMKVSRNKESMKREELLEGSNSNFLSNFGMALNEYIKLDGKTTYMGGIGWTWAKIKDGTLFDEEGIWISGRVAAGTVFQVVLIFVSPVAYYYALPEIMKSINPDYEEFGTRAKVALGVGMLFAFITSFTVTVLFIPNMVSTTLKFRRGALQTLRSEDFLHRYRFALDQATLVYGGMFWGVLFSSVAMALLTGGFVYILLWEETRQFVLGLVGNLLGLSVVLVTKIIIMQVIRFTHYAAFYRRKPFSTNIMTVVMECYAIGISIWFMVVRTIKIIVIGALYLGRIDTPLFSSGIGIFGPLEIDNWPTVTRKEILIHEAHRHPWIETLGYIYMMQLRFRDGHAKRACSAWRLIFVLSIMPWLHKYRDMTRPEHFGDEDEDKNEQVFRNDNYMRRMSTHMLQSSRRLSMQMLQPDALAHILDDDEDDEMSEELENSLPDSDRISQIENEMKRLQNELDTLKARSIHGEMTSEKVVIPV